LLIAVDGKISFHVLRVMTKSMIFFVFKLPLKTKLYDDEHLDRCLF
jgi:hypothetical protein